MNALQKIRNAKSNYNTTAESLNQETDYVEKTNTSSSGYKIIDRRITTTTTHVPITFEIKQNPYNSIEIWCDLYHPTAGHISGDGCRWTDNYKGRVGVQAKQHNGNILLLQVTREDWAHIEALQTKLQRQLNEIEARRDAAQQRVIETDSASAPCPRCNSYCHGDCRS